jgi:hypothetical protein
MHNASTSEHTMPDLTSSGDVTVHTVWTLLGLGKRDDRLLRLALLHSNQRLHVPKRGPDYSELTVAKSCSNSLGSIPEKPTATVFLYNRATLGLLWPRALWAPHRSPQYIAEPDSHSSEISSAKRVLPRAGSSCAPLKSSELHMHMMGLRIMCNLGHDESYMTNDGLHHSTCAEHAAKQQFAVCTSYCSIGGWCLHAESGPRIACSIAFSA